MTKALKFLIIIFFVASFTSCKKDSSKSSPTDVDAQKFIDSAGITDNTQKTALINFVTQLKDSSLWVKFKAIYPMLGGTASSAQWNLMNPQNTDQAFRLTFNGSPVFSTSGILFPTPSDFANTHLFDNMIAYNDNAISYYSLTQNSISGYDMGCIDLVSPYNEFAIYCQNDATVWFGYNVFGATPSNTKGLFILSSSQNDVKRYDNSIVTTSLGSAPVQGYTNIPILIGSSAGAPANGQRECALATIGNSLTDAQVVTFYNIVQKFESSLGRN